MIKVCKPVDVVRNAETCAGNREFRTCRSEVRDETIDICGEGDTFELAKANMQQELSQFVLGKCTSYISCNVQKSQSATDTGPTFWEKVGAFMKNAFLKCNVGEQGY